MEKTLSSPKKDDRTRTWEAIVYPESAPVNWEGLLSDYRVPWFCSPLHDKDLTDEGDTKKPHWHIIIAFDGKKSYDQVAAMTAAVNGTIPVRVENIKGAIQYLWHKNNPEKAQYQQSDVRCFNGADIDKYTIATQAEKLDIYGEIIDFIEANDITEFCDLVTYARYNERDWAKFLYSQSTIFFNSYITSRRNKKLAEEGRI